MAAVAVSAPDGMLSRLLRLRKETSGYWPDRILSELEYALTMSRCAGNAHDSLLQSVMESLSAKHAAAGALTREAAEETEERLQSIAVEAKSLTVLCAAHAHIDMNWLWRFDETVTVTLDTFRTVLMLMAEYPGFMFSQSQAATYRIVAEHDPGMLDEIRERVMQGRWEVTASTWVEADKNLPSGESLARHALLTKRYLSSLLGISPDTLLLDFEPDTFGHSRNVPEILRGAGVRWYYHCRGAETQTLYRWRAPSGASVLCYRDPFWYNAEVTGAIAAAAPLYCAGWGMDTMLRVYGVGDHGGGPTRRDIERIMDMDRWPIFPRVRFGTFREFFTIAEKEAERFPTVDAELNPIFDGCYSSQSRIKAANRIAEARLVEAETFSSIASAMTFSSPAAWSAPAWEQVLFNQFHDIVTGSGTVDTREYALGQFQRSMALAGTEEARALRKIASIVDTSSLRDPGRDSGTDLAEGGGAGHGIAGFGMSNVERGRGMTRVLHFFNPLPWPRMEVAEAVVWDWPGDPSRLQVKEAGGSIIDHQVIPNDVHPFFGRSFWNHEYLRVLVHVLVPGCGYSTCVLSEAAVEELPLQGVSDPRVQRSDVFVLENECLRAVFDPLTAALVSLVDKISGEEMINPSGHGGTFRLIQEDDSKGMTAWVVGRWMSVRGPFEGVKLSAVQGKGGLRQWMNYEIRLGASALKATVSLDRGASALCWSVECEWLEAGRKGYGVPQLNFHVPLAAEVQAYRFDIPFGTIDRPPAEMDQVANSWAVAVPRSPGRRAVMLTADQSHGFRCFDNALSLTLVRSSIDPDPYPELGMHRLSFAVTLVDPENRAALLSAGRARAHPVVYVSGSAHEGSLLLTHGFFAIDGAAAFSCMKTLEDPQAGRILVRLYETAGRASPVTLNFARAPSRAWLVNLNELPREPVDLLPLNGKTVSLEMDPYSVATIAVQFDPRA